jgi:CxxC motif-containing protein (DUF1111 family)
MPKWLAPLFVLCACMQHACGSDGGAAPLALEPGETRPGGDATNTRLFGVNSFNQPIESLTTEQDDAFFTGNSFFSKSWVMAPSSTSARDGVGPTFNARSCAGCHFKDGRAAPPDDDPTTLGLLLRLSIDGEDEHGGVVGDPSYGDQLQDRGIQDVPAEALFTIELSPITGEYEDGEAYELRAPTYVIHDLAFGELSEDIRVSPRLAPQVIGMGLLEAIPDARLRELEDPDDDDGDGISGRANRVWDIEAGEERLGRFGWKAEQPSVLQQSAAAFLGDIGATTRLFPAENCPGPQTACAAAINGGKPEVSDDLLDKVVLYTQALAVPARRSADDPVVLRGKALFREAGCDGCHVAKHVTGESEITALAEQTIFPYTDLLLHDMGDALGDDRPSFDAEGNEWRTPPLWGIGLIQDVNGHERLLHDGRARGVAEAILWHGGEAEEAKESFRTMNEDDRKALVRFVRSL